MARSSFELDGRPFQVAVISDVSWRHEADQIRDRFLGVLSHELRTPVTSIYGGTQLLLGRGARLDPETRNELLVSVAAEAERLQRMIENLVAMARIERGGDFGGVRPVLLDRIIKQLVEREKALWPEVTINLVSNGPVQMVAADEEYLAQIMRNLLSNAAKYCGAGSTVEVSLEDAEGEVLVHVRDDGPGIAEEDADRLFGLYYRAAPAGRDGARRGHRPVRVPRAGRHDGRPHLGEAAARARARSSGSASRPTSTSSTPYPRATTTPRSSSANPSRPGPPRPPEVPGLGGLDRREPGREVPERGRLLDDPEPAQARRALGDPDDDLDHVVDVALGVRAPRDREADEVHRRG